MSLSDDLHSNDRDSETEGIQQMQFLFQIFHLFHCLSCGGNYGINYVACVPEIRGHP